MAINIALQELAKIKATFNALPARLGDRVVMGALRAAAQPIRQDAQSLVPVLDQSTKYRHRGTVRKNISVRRSKQQKYSVFVGVVPYSRTAIKAFKKSQRAKGVKVTGKDVKAFRQSIASTISPDDPFYWWWQEFGTANMPAANNGQGFLRIAFERRKLEAVRRFEQYAVQRIKREAEKLAQEQGLSPR